MIKKASGVQGTSRTVSFVMTVTETLNAQNTDQVPSNYLKDDLIGMRIHTVEYSLVALYTQMQTSLDMVRWGLSILPQPSGAAFNWNSPGVVDFNNLIRIDNGTAAQANYWRDPMLVKPMQDRYPDGILVHPAGLHWWTNTPNAISATAYIYVTVYYDIVELTEKDWQALWQQFLVSSI
jgi:hypothetical protein